MNPEMNHVLSIRRGTRIHHLLSAAFLLLALSACSGSDQGGSGPAVRLEGDEQVLATVNGSPISAYDLEQAARTSLGEGAAGMLDEKGRQSLLESLVAARAIGQAQEKKLSDTERTVLEKQTAAYREQLLVKHYLAQNTDTSPVTQAMVEDYYQKHPEQFGARTLKQYELITSETALGDQARDQLLSALQHSDQQKDWAAWAEKLKQKGLPVVYKRGNADPAILAEPLRSLIMPLKAGQPSGLNFADGAVSLARVTQVKKMAPRPLGEVSARIRKTLLPVQLKKAVKQAAQEVLKQAKVDYPQK